MPPTVELPALPQARWPGSPERGRPAADWDQLRTPETYLGYDRGKGLASPGGAAYDEKRAFEIPRQLRLNHWALAGEWTIGPEQVTLSQAAGSIACQFHARDANLVLAHQGPAPIPFRVLLDGQAPGSSHGVDVSEDGTGSLTDGRRYQLIRQQDTVRERTLQITFETPGPRAYVFTFG